jgi:hypothetical protein
MHGLVVDVLNIGKVIIPCVREIGIIRAHDMHDHSIYDLGLAIYLGVEHRGFGELRV